MSSPEGDQLRENDVSGVALTIDVDWAPDAVVRDSVDLLQEYDVPATFFSTHPDGVDLPSTFERSLHPNFFGEQSDEAVLAALAKHFPNARGVRSHGLYTYTNLHDLYRNEGLTYESNYLLFNQFEAPPFMMHENILHFPIHFMDSMWLRTDRPQIGDWMNADSVVVFVFHPVHLYLNSPSLEFYENHKDRYDQPDSLLEARYDGDGIRDTFREILTAIEGGGCRIDTLGSFEENLRSS